MKKDLEKATTLAFVSVEENGERDFFFNRGADEDFSLDADSQHKLLQSEILHFGAATALLEGQHETTYMELMRARTENHFVSFDPNYRGDLWKEKLPLFVHKVKKCLPLADFVKFSDEELELISGINDRKAAAAKIHEYGVRYIAVTLGKEGTYFSNGNAGFTIPSIKISPVDTTGAGDTFVGSLLYKLSFRDDYKSALDDEAFLKDSLSFANCAAALGVCRAGT